MMRIGLFSAFPIAFRADVVDSLINHLLEFVLRNSSETFAGFLGGLVEDAPADGLLDELRDITLFHALGTKIGTQGKIGLLGPGDGQAGVFGLGHSISGHINVYPLISLNDCMSSVKTPWWHKTAANSRQS
jgi:hypothetical protein